MATMVVDLIGFALLCCQIVLLLLSVRFSLYILSFNLNISFIAHARALPRCFICFNNFVLMRVL